VQRTKKESRTTLDFSFLTEGKKKDNKREATKRPLKEIIEKKRTKKKPYQKGGKERGGRKGKRKNSNYFSATRGGEEKSRLSLWRSVAGGECGLGKKE